MFLWQLQRSRSDRLFHKTTLTAYQMFILFSKRVSKTSFRSLWKQNWMLPLVTRKIKRVACWQITNGTAIPLKPWKASMGNSSLMSQETGMESLNQSWSPNTREIFLAWKRKSFHFMHAEWVLVISMTRSMICTGLKCLLKWSARLQTRSSHK